MDTVSSLTNYIVVPPTTPNDSGTTKRISKILSEFEEIREAHLPCIIEFGENTQAKPALFIVVTEHSNKHTLRKTIDHKLNGGFFRRKSIAIKVITEDYPLLQSIRDTKCLIGWRD